MEPVQLEPAEMAAIHAACFPLRPWSAAEFESLMAQDGVFWGVDHKKRGFVLVRAAPGEAEILTLAVDPAHHRQGVARDLVQNVIRTCPMLNLDEVFLEVAADNAAAWALYDGLGFAEVGRRRAYYNRGEAPPADAVMMKRQIAEAMAY